MKTKLKHDQLNATRMVKMFIDSNAFTKKELGEKIGITQPTLRTRLAKNNWKISEMTLICQIYPF